VPERRGGRDRTHVVGERVLERQREAAQHGRALAERKTPVVLDVRRRE
jgi:hypothetical protein